MDVITAAQNMCHLIAGSGLPAHDSEYGKDHMYDMIGKIQSGEVSGEKAHRWLGYIQGCVVCYGGATLEEVKNVNFAA